MTIPKPLEAILISTPDTLHGAVGFADTRVPVDQIAYRGDILAILPSIKASEIQVINGPHATRY